MPSGRPPLFSGRFIVALFFASLLPLSGCATNPATGKKQISFVSRNKELEMGRQSDPAIIAEYGLYGDSTVAKYVQSVGLRVAKASDLPDLDWHFRLLDSPVVNAFAHPGWLHLHHARDPRLHELGGAARRRIRPRNRPRHRAAHRPADDPAADRAGRPHRGHGLRRAIPPLQRRRRAGIGNAVPEIQPRPRDPGGRAGHQVLAAGRLRPPGDSRHLRDAQADRRTAGAVDPELSLDAPRSRRPGNPHPSARARLGLLDAGRPAHPRGGIPTADRGTRLRRRSAAPATSRRTASTIRGWRFRSSSQAGGPIRTCRRRSSRPARSWARRCRSPWGRPATPR